MRTTARIGSVLALALLVSAPASAQVIHSFQIGVGAFLPRGYDARIAGDVLVEDLNSLAFKTEDFRSARVFGEWDVAFGDHVEVGAGIGFYSRGVPSVYRDFVNVDGSEIEQDLHLRIVPISGVVRFLPFGQVGTFRPYVGAGVTVMRWRYSESGDFIDFTDYSIFRDRFVASGTDLGGLLLGGIRVPLGGDVFGMGAEVRYQWGSGDTGGLANGFLADKIDLSGPQVNFSFIVHY